MIIIKWTHKVFMIALLAILFSLVTGCGGGSNNDDNQAESVNNSETENNNDNNNNVVANNFVGTWLIQKEDTSSFWIFNDNGTFVKKRAGEPLNGTTHFSGTYSVDGGFLTGEFINPGVGNGEIEGTINESGTFLMDFIEYWHSPRKVVPCVGVRQ